MMNIPRNDHSEAVDNARHMINVFARTNPSHWSQPVSVSQRIRRWFGRFSALFCCMEDEWLNMEMESRCRDDIRQEMMSHYGPNPTSHELPPLIRPARDATLRIFNQTGYDMIDYRSQLTAAHVAAADIATIRAQEAVDEALAEEMPLEPEEEVELDVRALARNVITEVVNEEMRVFTARTGIANRPPTEPTQTARMIPHFAATMVLQLRAKFGRLPLNDANRMLIEREYLRICREGSVRHVDIALHEQWVMNAFFNEGVLEELPTTRLRVPGWMRRAFGSAPSAPAAAC